MLWSLPVVDAVTIGWPVAVSKGCSAIDNGLHRRQLVFMKRASWLRNRPPRRSWQHSQGLQAGAQLWVSVGSGGSRRSTCRNTSQATPAMMPPVQSLRRSSTIEIVLAPMRRPRSRKRPSFSRSEGMVRGCGWSFRLAGG